MNLELIKNILMDKIKNNYYVELDTNTLDLDTAFYYEYFVRVYNDKGIFKEQVELYATEVEAAKGQEIEDNFFKLLEFLQNSFKNVEIVDDIVII